MNKGKKILSILVATLSLSALSLTGCGKSGYAGDELGAKDESAVIAETNGGFSVETQDYLYFINGKAESTAKNSYGDVVKGSLMRISKADLAAGKYAEAKTVVPSLFVAGDYDSGIYIYDGYVYYATPTADKNKDGAVDNTSLDFKRAKLDGTEAPMGGKNDYFFRLPSNTTKYRYVKEGDTVYCMYEQDGKLKSYNTATGTTSVLVSGAGTFIYDKQDLTNPNVYYTMSVTPDLDRDNSSAATYNQIYCVNAASTATVNAETATYTVKDGAGNEIQSYAFNKDFLTEKNAEAKKDKKDEPYKLSDYSTYPYVNLGTLVLDGVSKKGNVSGDNRFNWNASDIGSASEFGYTYTLQQQANGGIYFTREPVVKNDNKETAKLYYLANDRTEWNTVKGNDSLSVVSTDTTNASSSAIFTINEDGSHSYIYRADSVLKKATVKEGVISTVNMAFQVATDITLWKLEGEYLYYYGTGTNGKSLSRIVYTGTQDEYNWDNSGKFDAQTVALVDFNDSWYKPETVKAGEKELVLFSGAQSFGSGGTAYNYVYAVDMTDIETRNEAIEEIDEVIAKGSTTAQAVMKYYYRTGSLAYYDEVIDLYNSTQKQEVTDFVAKFAENGEFAGRFESSYIQLLGKMSEEDVEAVGENWKNSLLKETEAVEEEKKGLPTWAIVLIVCGGVLVVATAVLVPTLIVVHKKKEKKRKEEAVVNAYKRKKIDTTDDTSIDVYSDEDTPVEAPVSAETENAEEAPAEPEQAE